MANKMHSYARAVLGMVLLAGALLATLPATAQTGNFCVRDFQGGAVCTANDVRIEALTPVNVIEDCNSGTLGETEVVFEALVSAAGSPDRYDIGLYLALDGGSARDGDSCFHDYLEPPLSSMITYGDKNMDGVNDIDSPPWFENDGDSCGDIATNTQVFKTLSAQRFACVDSNLDGSVDVSVCTSWDNNAGTVCSTVAEAFPGTNSKCSCGSVELGIPPYIPPPDLSITKSDGGATATPGGTISYTLDYANNGQSATGVEITETVPANTTFDAGSSTAGWSCAPDNAAGSTCTFTVGALAAAGSGSVTFAVTVDDPLAAGVDQISNTASIADDGTNGTDPTPGDNSSTDTTPVTAAPDFSITKSDGGASSTAGGTISYTLDYANNGNQDATGVEITDTVPANTTFDAGTSTAGWVCSPDGSSGSTCTFTIGALAAGASGSVTFAVTVDDPLAAGVDQISNTATIADDGANGTDPTPGDNSSTDTTPVTAAPDLSITKSDGGATSVAGGTISYTLDYANNGDQDATGVEITDTVPANTTFDAGTSTAGWVCSPDGSSGSTCTFTIGALAAGDSGSVTFAVTVDDPLAAGVSVVSNTATIADDGTNGTDPTPGDNTSTDTTPATAAPDLSITKSDGGATATEGGTISYTLSYANNGDQDATGVEITDTVPANTTLDYATSTPGWTCAPTSLAGGVCTFTIGALAAGDSGSVIFAVTVDDPLAGGVTEINNTAVIADDGANGVDPTPGDNTGSDTTPISAVLPPDLTITKSDGGSTATPGSTISYSLDYENVGDGDATGVTITDTVPANTTFNAGASTAGWSCVPSNAAGSTCTFNVGAVSAGGSGSVTFAVTVDDPLAAGVTEVSNTASITDDGSSGSDPTPGNNSSTDTTPVTAAPDLSITKSDGGATAIEGGTISYTLSYANNGDQDATGVTITDTVPANTTLDYAASTTGWTCAPTSLAGGVCTFTVGALAAGDSGSVIFAVTVDDPLAGGVSQISNTASIADDGSNGPDPTPGDNTGSDTTPVAGFVVTASKSSTLLDDTDGSGNLSPGDLLRYTVTLQHSGAADALDVVFDDTPDANTILEVGSVAPSTGTVTSGNTAGDTTVGVDIGTMSSGDTVTIVFDVRLVDPFPDGVTQIINQGLVSGSNFPSVPTDDPGSPPTGDGTIDTVTVPMPGPIDIPTVSEWGMLMLLLLLASAAIWSLRRRQTLPIR